MESPKNFLFDHVDGFEFCLGVLAFEEETTAKFLALAVDIICPALNLNAYSDCLG